MKLFIDTETTGFPKYSLLPSDLSQPKLVQLAAILTDDKGKEECSMNIIVSPFEYKIPGEVAEIHGITTDKAINLGVKKNVALEMFLSFYGCADEIIAHNVKFDLFIMQCAASPYELNKKSTYCTMINYRKLGFVGSARLMEAHKQAFNKDFKNSHNAMNDCQAMMRLYFWLKEVEKENVRLRR